MKTKIECIDPEDSAQSAARKMRDAKVGFLPICDPAGRALGTLTDRDITLRLVAEGLPGSTPVSSLMQREVVSCRPQDDLNKAHELMGSAHKSRLLVVDEDQKLVGVISLSDIAQKGELRRAGATMREVSSREAR